MSVELARKILEARESSLSATVSLDVVLSVNSQRFHSKFKLRPK